MFLCPRRAWSMHRFGMGGFSAEEDLFREGWG